MHPRFFVFDRHFKMVPAARFASLQAVKAEATDEDDESDATESEDDDIEEAGTNDWIAEADIPVKER